MLLSASRSFVEWSEVTLKMPLDGCFVSDAIRLEYGVDAIVETAQHAAESDVQHLPASIVIKIGCFRGSGGVG